MQYPPPPPNTSPGQNQLEPEEHHDESQDMDVDEDQDPIMPPSGMPTHPIDISSGSTSYAGSPYQGPGEWAEWWGQYKWEYTPSYHNTPPQHQAMEPSPPPPPPVEEQPPPPPLEPSRRRRNARMSGHGGPHFSSPYASNTYPTILQDPQMGGPSNPAPVIDTTQATFAQPPPPMGFENPIPTYPAATGYNPFEPTTSMGYNYQAPSYDPYAKAIVHNTLYPSPFPPAYPTGYPAYGYQYPAPPPPQPQPQLLPQQMEVLTQALGRVDDMEREWKEVRGKQVSYLRNLQS
ncbi:hypothetical protein Hanom_Chr16g01448521 [Helianthus anomalus]